MYDGGWERPDTQYQRGESWLSRHLNIILVVTMIIALVVFCVVIPYLKMVEKEKREHTETSQVFTNK